MPALRTRATGHPLRRVPPSLLVGATALATLAAALVTLGTGAAAPGTPAPRAPSAPVASATGGTLTEARAGVTAGAATSAAAAPPVAPLAGRVRPDALVTSDASMSAAQLAALERLGRTVVVRVGTVTLAGHPVQALGVDPSAFRAFTAEGTAESDAVWQTVARGDLAVAHAAATAAGQQLGVPVAVAGAGRTQSLRLGAIATTGIPRADVVVDDATGGRLGLLPSTGVLVAAPEGTDPAVLGGAIRAAVGSGARVDLLAPATADPVAFLTGGRAAQAFGSFSYRYYPDGTIEPDPAWVKANIEDAVVPILGRVTCHRLMVPQLRGALQEVQDAGLASLVHTYDGCFVPKFIPDTDKAVSLHAWGIAVDIDAATNYRGIRGTMDDRVVAIFKKWGFRWGGDWHYTDPMHFELGALLATPPGKG